MEFVEDDMFTKSVQPILSDEAYGKLQAALMKQPDLGVLIPGGKGLRKLRWPAAGKGKSGGVRIIYCLYPAEHKICMYYAYKKTRQEDLTPKQLKILVNYVKEGGLMKEEHFKELLMSIDQMRAIMRGERKPSRVFRYTAIDIKKIRHKLKLTQAEFAALLCVSPATFRNWEQSRTCPEGPAMTLLRIAESNPQAIFDCLHKSKKAA